MFHKNIIISVFFTLCSFSSSLASVLFEGYSRVFLGGVPIGYAISRYEFDNKSKEFVATTFLKTNELGGNITESLKARSNSKFHPIAFNYTSISGAKTKTIDATFKNQKMQATIIDDGKPEKISRDIPKKAFLSSFLVYLMIQSPEGLKPHPKPFEYTAIAEEDAVAYSGVSFVQSAETYKGFTVLKILNSLKKPGAEKESNFISYTTDKGEVLATKAPSQSLSTELMASAEAATKGFSVNNASLSLLFGSVPVGKDNIVAQSQTQKNATTPTEIDPKSSNKFIGTPANKGVYVKGKPLQKSDESSARSEVNSTPVQSEKISNEKIKEE